MREGGMQVTAKADHALRAATVPASVRANERAVLESVTLADLAAGRLPDMTSVGRASSA